jgi:hypothetical protein
MRVPDRVRSGRETEGLGIYRRKAGRVTAVRWLHSRRTATALSQKMPRLLRQVTVACASGGPMSTNASPYPNARLQTPNAPLAPNPKLTRSPERQPVQSRARG